MGVDDSCLFGEILQTAGVCQESQVGKFDLPESRCYKGMVDRPRCGRIPSDLKGCFNATSVAMQQTVVAESFVCLGRDSWLFLRASRR